MRLDDIFLCSPIICYGHFFLNVLCSGVSDHLVWWIIKAGNCHSSEFCMLARVNVLMVSPLKGINIRSGGVWNRAKQIEIHISLSMHFFFFLRKTVSQKVTYYVLGHDRFQSMPLTQKYSKIIHASEWHLDSLSQRPFNGHIVQFTKEWESCFQYREFLNVSFSPTNISYWLQQLPDSRPFKE